jgi:hypothetical protein
MSGVYLTHDQLAGTGAFRSGWRCGLRHAIETDVFKTSKKPCVRAAPSQGYLHARFLDCARPILKRVEPQ